MEFRQLETFVEVTNLKSFSKAADKLFITQPTVTNHIQNLEKELNTLLINRCGKQISLTDAGSLLYKYAINIINSCEMAKFDLAAYKGKIYGHLNIYSSSVPRKSMLPFIMKDFLTMYPNVSFSLLEKDSAGVINSILNGKTDFGIVGAKLPNPKIEYINLMDDNLVLITPNSSKYPFKNFSYVDKDILYNEKLLFREKGSGTRQLIEKSLDISDLQKLHIIAYIEDIEVIKQLVSLGVGISFVSERSINKKTELEKYKVFYIEGLDLKRKFYFAFHKSRQLSPLNETFKMFILEYIKTKGII